eukprot:Skav205240  [mRNA]  locus=scaffold1794:277000:277818:- [translate_table: standard]
MQTILGVLTLFAALWFYMKLLRSLVQLSEELSRFSIRAAKCFCCSVDHCMPETGEEIPCDRRVIYGTLGMWYSGEAKIDPLDSFDQEVRTQMTDFAAERFGSGYLPVRYFTYMVMVCRICMSFSRFGLAVIRPPSDLLDIFPPAANPIVRVHLLLDDPIRFTFALVVIIALVRLTERISCSKRCLLVQVTLILLVTEGVLRGQWSLRAFLGEISREAAFASEIVQLLFCVAALRVMASRSKTETLRSSPSKVDLFSPSSADDFQSTPSTADL